jgi:hypothetical protein
MVYALHFGAISAISQVHPTLSRQRARSRKKALAASLQDTLVISSPIPIPYVGYLTVLPSAFTQRSGCGQLERAGILA